MCNRVKTLLRNGNLQEKRNKEFTLKLTTALIVVFVFGYLTGLSTFKIMSEPPTYAAQHIE